MASAGMPGSSGPPKVVVVFGGVYSEKIPAGKGLYETNRLFKFAYDRVAELSRRYTPLDLRQIVMSDKAPLDLAEPCNLPVLGLFRLAFQYGLMEMFKEIGLQPTAVFGESVGEISVAVFVGSVSIEDAVNYVGLRFGLFVIHKQSCLNGAWGVVRGLPCTAEVAQKAIEEVSSELSPWEVVQIGYVAAGMIALSGHERAIGCVCKRLGCKIIAEHPFPFHSSLVEPIAAACSKILPSAGVRFAAPPPDGPKVISSLTGSIIGDEFGTLEYWLGHDQGKPCLFYKAMQTAVELGCDTVLEIGCKPYLAKSLSRAEEFKAFKIVAPSWGGASGQQPLHDVCQTLGLWPRLLPVPVLTPIKCHALCLLPAVEQAEAVLLRRVSAAGLLEAHIARIQEMNGPIRAVTIRNFEKARERARQADETLGRGESWGPLHGVPITVKESIMVAGLGGNVGQPFYASFVSRANALVVQRLVDAGAIILGKTNVPIGAADFQTNHPQHGRTSNPWDLSRTSGGSSGGSAAAVACGFAAIEVGTDIAGSCRQPAHYCGVCCHRPSWGLGHTHGVLPNPNHSRLDRVDRLGKQEPLGHYMDQSFSHGMEVTCPIARCCADLELAFRLASPPEPIMASGGWSFTPPAPTCQDVRKLRVASWLDSTSARTDRDYLFLLEAAVGALETAGAKVDRTARPFTEEAAKKHHATFRSIRKTISAMGFEGYTRLLHKQREDVGGGSCLEPYLSNAPQTYTAEDLAQQTSERSAIKQQFCDFFKDHDVLMTPVFPMPADPHSDQEHIERMYKGKGIPDFGWKGLTFWPGLVSVADLPATVIPIGRTPSGLPCGIQVVAPIFHDLTSIEVGKMLEQFHPPSSYQPPPGFEPEHAMSASPSRL